MHLSPLFGRYESCAFDAWFVRLVSDNKFILLKICSFKKSPQEKIQTVLMKRTLFAIIFSVNN